MLQRADSRFGQSFLTRPCGQPTLLDGKRATVTENDGSLDDILQLTDITRPTIGATEVESQAINFLEPFPGFARITL